MVEPLAAYEGVVAAFQAMNEAVKEALAPFGITPAQFGVLRRLEPGEEVSLSELAERLGCTNANVTRLVENMVRLELLERSSNPQDRRVVLVRLSSKGLAVREEASEAYARAVERVVSVLPEEERSVLVRLRARFA
jgi:DNA-binding MarR family transcriptional regulator